MSSPVLEYLFVSPQLFACIVYVIIIVLVHTLTSGQVSSSPGDWSSVPCSPPAPWIRCLHAVMVWPRVSRRRPYWSCSLLICFHDVHVRTVSSPGDLLLEQIWCNHSSHQFLTAIWAVIKWEGHHPFVLRVVSDVFDLLDTLLYHAETQKVRDFTVTNCISTYHRWRAWCNSIHTLFVTKSYFVLLSFVVGIQLGIRCSDNIHIL